MRKLLSKLEDALSKLAIKAPDLFALLVILFLPFSTLFAILSLLYSFFRRLINAKNN